MTDEMTLQGQRPSAAPFLLGGAALGATAGYFVDKTGWNGVPKAKYTSMEDILKESKDTFTKNDIPDGLKDDAKKLGDARAEYIKYIKDNAKFKSELDAEAKVLAEKTTAYKDATKTAVDGIIAKIKNNEIEIKDLDKTKDEDVLKAARKYLKEHIGEDAYKDVKEALTAQKEARTALEAKAKSAGVEAHKVVEGLKDKGDKIFEGIKDSAAKFKTANKWLNALIGGSVLALAALLIRPKAKDQ